MIYELKKIFSTKLSKLSVLALIILTFAISIFAYEQHTTIDESYSGKASFEYGKSLEKDYEGPIDKDLIDTFVSTIDLSQTDEKAIVDLSRNFPTLTTTFKRAYDPAVVGDNKFFENLLKTGGSDFYDRNTINIKTILDENLNKSISEKEKFLILERAESIDTPYKFEYADFWNLVYDALSLIILISFVVIIFQISSIYSIESESSMVFILRSLGDKKSRKIIYDKIKALILVVGCQVLLASFIFILVSFYFTRLSGFDASIQVLYFNSIYSYSFGQVLMISIIGFLLSAIALALIVFVLNIFIKSSFPTLILGLIGLFLPKFLLNIFSTNNLGSKLLSSLPIAMVAIRDNITSLSLGLFNSLWLYSVIGLSLVIIIVSIFILILKGRRS